MEKMREVNFIVFFMYGDMFQKEWEFIMKEFWLGVS